MIYVLYLIHVVVSLFLILVVLLQQGSGADLSVFGGGATQAAFGARGAATVLHKLTVAGFIAFILTTIGIGFLQSGSARRSVMGDAAQEVEAVADPAEDPAAPAAVEPQESEVDGDTTGETGAAEDPSPPAGEDTEAEGQGRSDG